MYDAAFNWANDIIHTALVNVVSMFAGTMQSAHIALGSYIHLSYRNNNIIREKYRIIFAI